jgi:hypothetical protein
MSALTDATRRWQLFHALDDAGSAAARRRVVELDLKDEVDFRNLHYPKAAADFAAHGGERVPALWDGARQTLVEGEQAVLDALAELAARTTATAR